MTAQSKNFSEIGGQAAALMLTGLKAITGITETLTARHVDPFGDEGEHEHTWHITALYAAEPFRDGRALKAGLRKLLDSFPAVLPRELWAGEDIAKRVLLLPECIGARVWRSEGFEAWAFADATIVAALRERDALKEEVERLRGALEPFAIVGQLFHDSAGNTQWREAPLFYCGTRDNPHSHTLTGRAFAAMWDSAPEVKP